MPIRDHSLYSNPESSFRAQVCSSIHRLRFHDSMIFIDKRSTEAMGRMLCDDHWINEA
jgi:hypothetical protein